ncbi:hypothetical protein LTS14_000649 [Recurvomyces mirabilis]|uniref:uncharacterized protein n=1 Tax=Recurvomyces mirabilis TaxID=574656 RepID=UPI002DE090C9|nr:hypothetical protein LTS14_000649 [Recurvomyces mirabilis]
MSHPQAPQRQPTTSETDRYARTIHNVAIGALVACPLLALLPPRKLDFFTWGLIGTTGYSANYLTREQTGRSIWQHVNGTRASLMQTEAAAAAAAAAAPPIEQESLNKELQRARQEMQRLRSEAVSVTEQVASQSQREAWKAQREKEIQDDLDVGKGFGEMITDQIWEVWNGGKKKEDEDDG